MAALSRRLRPLRCVLALAAFFVLALRLPLRFVCDLCEVPEFTKGYSLLRSRRIRRTVALEPIFPLVPRVSLCASLQFLRASSELLQS